MVKASTFLAALVLATSPAARIPPSAGALIHGRAYPRSAPLSTRYMLAGIPSCIPLCRRIAGKMMWNEVVKPN
jgi:hypothetical protein